MRTLPLASKLHDAPRPMRLRVLLAEDDPDLRRLLVWALRREDCEVVEVSSGTELFDRIADDLLADDTVHYDVIVADVRMPGWSGLDALRGLRSSGLQVPVVLTTTTADGQADQARQQGAVLLDKPFDVDDFVEVVLDTALCERPTLVTPPRGAALPTGRA